MMGADLPEAASKPPLSCCS